MSHHPPVRLARSAEFLALGCVHRLVFRALWVRGELRRWATDPDASAEDRVFCELEALGLLVGPGARGVFDEALSAWLRTGAMKREGRDLVLPILTGDTAREKPSAATLRKRRQRERERQQAGPGSHAAPERDIGRDIDPASHDSLTPVSRDADRDRAGGGRDMSRDGGRASDPERREEEKILSSSSGTSEGSEIRPISVTARASPEQARPAVTRDVTRSPLTETEVFEVIERVAGGRVGVHPRALRGRFMERLVEEDVTREQVVVMMELAREGKLYLQEPGRVMDLALLVGPRDSEVPPVWWTVVLWGQPFYLAT